MTIDPPRVALDYLGCKVNQAEIEELGQRFRQAGYVLAAADQADVYILNTCTITHVADRKARLLIHQAARRRPRPLIVVTGCYPSVDPAAVAAIEGVDLVVSNADKRRLVEIVETRLLATAPGRPRRHGYPLGSSYEDAERVASASSLQAETWTEGRSPLARTRAMLKVQDGCDHFCTYCIVPRARGGVRSTPISEVVDMIRQRTAQGYKEVVLTGVALGSYGRDGGRRQTSSSLHLLVETILRDTTVPRLRLSSIEPENLEPGMLNLWSDHRFCRHLHLPLQSGCDVTLKRMGRRYRTADYAALVEQARAIAPDVAITTDIIVGFPGETDDHFAQSYRFAEAMQFAKIHVFRFSPRRGTPATRLAGPVPEAVKKERAQAMIGLSERSGRTFRRRFIGTRREVLWEEVWAPDGDQDEPSMPEATWWTGLTDNYIRVYARVNGNRRDQIDSVELIAETNDGLLGGDCLPLP